MSTTNKVPLFTVDSVLGTQACVAATITQAGQDLIAGADAAAQRTTLGLGTLATQSGTFSGTASGTNTGDQTISDATISTTDITTNDATTAKHGFLPKLGGGTTNFLRADGAWAAPAGGPGASWTAIEQNLGAAGSESWRGKFTLTDAAISPTSKVIIMHAPGPYTGKGTLADEAEMDPLWCVAAPGSGQATVYWRTMAGVATTYSEVAGTQPVSASNTQHGTQFLAPLIQRTLGKVRGNVKFQYTVA